MAIIGRLQKNLVNFGDKILFEQFLCGRLYRTGRSKTVPFDEIGRCNTLGFALPGDGIKQLLLLSGTFDRISRKIVSFEAIILSMAARIVSNVHSSPSGVSANDSLKVFWI